MRRLSFTLGAASLVLSAAFLAGLKRLPYSSSSLQGVTLLQADAPPSNTSYDVGPLHWDLEAYRSAPSLEPLRAFKQAHCATETGLDAAVCVSNAFAEKFPHGTPQHEFVDTSYDPASVLAEHLAGAPGHCVTRSGLLAATLLACGQPARVVQFISTTGVGHNVIEVWGSQTGWVMFDPTYGGSVTDETHPLSTAAAAKANTLTWRANGLAAITDTSAAVVYTNAETALLPGSTVLYPEPWLYTRVGARQAPFPFRGAFAHVGGSSWQLGPAQHLCHWGFALSALAGVALIAASLRARARSEADVDADADDTEATLAPPTQQQSLIDFALSGVQRESVPEIEQNT